MKFTSLATAAVALLAASAFGGVEAKGGAKPARTLDSRFGDFAAELKIAATASHEKDTFKDIMNHLKKNPSIIDLNFKRDSDDAERRLDLGARAANVATDVASHDLSRDAARNFFNHVVMPIKMQDHFRKPSSKINNESAMEKLLKNYNVDAPSSEAIEPHRRLQLPPGCTQTDSGVACGIITDTYFAFFFNCPAVPTSEADCADCEVFSLVNDPTPDDVTDNPICASCSVCSAGSSSLSYDCSNEFTTGCVTLDCNGNCGTGGGGTGGGGTGGGGGGDLPDGCLTLESGAISCGIITNDYLAVFFNCPATLTGPEDCQNCDVVSLVGDPTPDDVADNPICTSCSVCATGASPFEYDCSNEFTTGCITLGCDNVCNAGTVTTPPPSGTVVSPPSVSPPPPTPPTSTGTLPAGCFETDQGNVGCGFDGDGFVTIFFNCPPGFGSPGECSSCQTVVDDQTPDELTDNPICNSCTTCATGASDAQHDCSNEISTGCVFLDCNGVCSTTSGGVPGTTPPPSPSNLPDDCLVLDSGNIACGIVTDTYFVIFFDCPATLTSPTDCPQCDVISLVRDPTPDDVADNPLCTSCSVCGANSPSPFAYDCANEFTSSDGCLTIGCDGSCDGGGQATSPPTAAGGAETKPPTPLIIPPLKPTLAPPTAAPEGSGTFSYSTIVALGLMVAASVFGMLF